MTRIRVLPEILSNKIAAGEVVERPASVVKELVENAIDAESTRITVEISQGGRSRIRVADNGAGMTRDDALLALERYATSKIYEDPDLYAISTLGFRGEALPSIAAVSKFTLTTHDGSDPPATRIFVEGGRIKQVDETGAPPGTVISVDQLFFNTPARRKFLKTVNTEMGHIADGLSAVALAWKDIQFRLFHNDRAVKNWPAVKNGYDRVVDVLGSDLRDRLYPVAREEGDFRISGWVSEPGMTRSSAQKLYIYINGRYIRDRGVYYAILDGYKGRLMKGRFPIGALFIELPPAEVDVNVHPTKHEVRFTRQKELYQAIRAAVAAAFTSPKWPGLRPAPAAGVEESVHSPDPSPPKESRTPASETASSETASEGQPRAAPAPSERGLTGLKTQPGKPPASAATPSAEPSEPLPQQAGKQQTPPSQEPPAHAPAARAQRDLWDQPPFSQMSVMGQFKNTYILCEAGDTLYLIDQHAAHERIVYEKLIKEREQSGSGPVQNLMIPETVELSYREGAAIAELIPDLAAIGISVEPFGSSTFIVKSLPAIIDEHSARPLLTEIAETVAEAGYRPGLDKTIDACLTLMACHGAIRANQALTEKEIRALLAQLEQCENPYHCPHGRPTVIHWSLDVLEKKFRRTV